MNPMRETSGAIELPRYRDNPAEYRNAWTKRKRVLDPSFARRQSEAARQWQLTNPVRNSWNQGRAGARKRDLEWTLTREEHEAIVLSDCFYCGQPSDWPKINGVDRVDNSAGYTSENIVAACCRCNYAKRDMAVDEFYDWIDRVAQYRREHG